MTAIETVLLAIAPRDEPGVRAGLAAARPALSVRHLNEGAPDLSRAALIAFHAPPEAERLTGIPWIHCAGAGADRLIAGLPVLPPRLTRTVGRMGEQIGEYVAAYMLADLQKMALRRDHQRTRCWNRDEAAPACLFDQRVLVFGTGGIGAGVARTLSALGAAIDGVSLSGRAKAPFTKVFSADTMPEDLTAYDGIICTLPATSATRGFVGASLLARCSDALLISVGRGAAVDVNGVLGALDRGQLRHAVLDVFDAEPLPSASSLWGHRGVTVTPHVSGMTRPQDIAEAFLTELERLESGQPPALPVDPAAGY